MTSKLAAIIFDMDGTLINSEEPYFSAMKDIIASYGHVLDREYWNNSFPGRGAKVITRALIEKFNLDITPQALEDTWNEACAYATFPEVRGASSFIARLQVKAAIGTGSSTAIAKQLTHDIGINLPIVGIDQVSKGKPDPETFLRAAQLINVQPHECVVVEDSIAGLISAKQAGMRCIGLCTTLPRTLIEQAQPNYICESYEEIEHIITTMEPTAVKKE